MYTDYIDVLLILGNLLGTINDMYINNFVYNLTSEHFKHSWISSINCFHLSFSEAVTLRTYLSYAIRRNLITKLYKYLAVDNVCPYYLCLRIPS